MALLNYSSPFLGGYTAPPLPPPIPAASYHYPRPPNPFTHEDHSNLFQHHQQHHHQQLHQQHPPQPILQRQQHTQQGGVQQGGQHGGGQQAAHQQVDSVTPHYTRVHSNGVGGGGGGGSDNANTKTRVHAVIDYDEGDYYEDGSDSVGGGYSPGGGQQGIGLPHGLPHVTPIQGPIYLKNGSVPVVPLYSYPQLNNGSFVQIPILWTALSVALGLELKGEYIRGVPCIKRHQQLFCPTAGNTYPIDRIELFIDENKALMKRMYGEFIMGPDFGPDEDNPRPGSRSSSGPGSTANHNSGRKQKRATKDQTDNIRNVPPGVPDLHGTPGAESVFGNLRGTRQSFRNNQSSESGRVDACESKIEIVTPYWASNSAGKIRAIVNTQHFEQAIHQEVCAKSRTNRCSGDCGCEQKYKWHRLLAYDPDNDCKGIFMDWFLFPSCCVCRCNPT